jgi:glutamate-ammonia-ligase adenylyltransferase
VDRAQPLTAIRAELAELCRGAEDLGPILRGFRNKELVRIGTRDILRREPIREVTRELADVAEVIIDQVARDQYRRRARRFGQPRRPGGSRVSRWAIVALGKFGGRELNYHSDLDLIFLHEGDGFTDGGESGAVANVQFHADLAQKVLKAVTGPDGQGPLFSVDTRLRPLGASGPLTITLSAFRDYYRGRARAWERLALTRARVIHARGGFGRDVTAAIRQILTEPVDASELARHVLEVRRKLEDAALPGDLKRGPGGLVDVELLVQFLQLAHASAHPRVLHANTWEALNALRRAGLIDPATHRDLRASYDFRRTLESRLQIVHNHTYAKIPTKREELARLARRLGYDRPGEDALVASFQEDVTRHAERTRALFLPIMTAAALGVRS